MYSTDEGGVMEENVIVEDTSEELFTYLESHIKDFSPSNKDNEFIKDTLKLNEKKQVQIDGAIALPLLGLVIGLLSSCYHLIFTGLLNNIITISIVGVLSVFQISLLILVSKKKRIVKPIFIVYFLLFILLRGFALISTISGILWIVYMIRSRRVKYTFVE